MNSSFARCHDPGLHPYVTAFWQTEGRPAYRRETILPKGVIELIFSFDEPVVYNGERYRHGLSTPRCFVNGMSSKTIQLQVPARQSFFGIELHPAAARSLLSAPCGSFLDDIADLESVNTTFASLWHQLAEAASFHKRTSIAQEWLRGRLRPVHDRELAIAGFLKSNGETDSVSALASQFCYSTRQLQRKMQEFFGMPTEAVIRYKRYLHALQQIHYGSETLTRVAHGASYYDQAHFNREFKDFTGLTPRQYRQQQTRLAGHLYQ